MSSDPIRQFSHSTMTEMTNLFLFDTDGDGKVDQIKREVTDLKSKETKSETVTSQSLEKKQAKIDAGKLNAYDIDALFTASNEKVNESISFTKLINGKEVQFDIGSDPLNVSFHFNTRNEFITNRKLTKEDKSATQIHIPHPISSDDIENTLKYYTDQMKKKPNERDSEFKSINTEMKNDRLECVSLVGHSGPNKMILQEHGVKKFGIGHTIKDSYIFVDKDGELKTNTNGKIENLDIENYTQRIDLHGCDFLKPYATNTDKNKYPIQRSDNETTVSAIQNYSQKHNVEFTANMTLMKFISMSPGGSAFRFHPDGSVSRVLRKRDIERYNRVITEEGRKKINSNLFDKLTNKIDWNPSITDMPIYNLWGQYGYKVIDERE